MPEYQHIRIEQERGRARIVLNRPARHNAITASMELELDDALGFARQPEAVGSPKAHP